MIKEIKGCDKTHDSSFLRWASFYKIKSLLLQPLHYWKFNFCKIEKCKDMNDIPVIIITAETDDSEYELKETPRNSLFLIQRRVPLLSCIHHHKQLSCVLPFQGFKL